MRSRWAVALLCAVAGALLAASLSLFVADRTGTDDAATAVVTRENPSYEPWFASVWAPGSDATETLLFAAQGGVGAGALGWVVATLRQRQRSRPQQPPRARPPAEAS